MQLPQGAAQQHVGCGRVGQQARNELAVVGSLIPRDDPGDSGCLRAASSWMERAIAALMT
jgi:hypothetical protein